MYLTKSTNELPSSTASRRIRGARLLLQCRTMTNDKTIRVGFIADGGNTRLHHIPKLKAQPGIELVAVANRTKESGERVAREFGIARVHGDWRAIVDGKALRAELV